MKTCPYCLAEIHDEARKCRHCGEWVEPHIGDPAAGPPTPSAGAATPPGNPAEYPRAAALPPPAEVAKPCRMCGEPFRPGAVLCLACGYDTRTGRIRPGVGRVRTDDSGTYHSVWAHHGRQLAVASAAVCGVAWLVWYWTDPPALIAIGVLAAVSALAALGAVTFGAVGLIEVARDNTRTVGGTAAVVALLLGTVAGAGDVLLGLFGWATVETARQELVANDWKQIGVALHNYHDAHRRFPASAARDKDGRPLLSWRVAVLPYLEHDALYGQFKLDEPWDSEHNLRLLDKMPNVYRRPGEGPGASETRVQAFVGKGAAFEGVDGLNLSAFSDGTSNTILLAEAATAVPWTKPDDMAFDPVGSLPELSRRGGQTVVLMGDGSVRFLPATVPEPTLRSLITRNGGEVVSHPF